MIRFDKVPSTFLNISGSFYITNDLNFHNQSTLTFEAKFNFQVAIKSADLGLDEKIIQENHYHTWD